MSVWTTPVGISIACFMLWLLFLIDTKFLKRKYMSNYKYSDTPDNEEIVWLEALKDREACIRLGPGDITWISRENYDNNLHDLRLENNRHNWLFLKNTFKEIPDPRKKDLNCFPEEGSCKVISPDLIDHLKISREEPNKSKSSTHTAVAWNKSSYWFVITNSHKTLYNIEHLKPFFINKDYDPVTNSYSVVQPKELTELPEKWCIKHHKSIIDGLNQYRESNRSKYPSYRYNWEVRYNNNCFFYSQEETNPHSSLTKHQRFTEITVEQFKKWVLKEEKTETLLEKAARLYPIGTKYIALNDDGTKYAKQKSCHFPKQNKWGIYLGTGYAYIQLSLIHI